MKVADMKTQFKKYPTYKDSGEIWLGHVPEHWDVRNLKSILAERKEKNDPVKTKDILSLSMHRGVTPYSDKGRGGNKAKDDLTKYKIARPNDIVLNSMNVIVGSVGLSKYFGAISPVYYALYARRKDTSIRFYDHLFQNPNFQMSLFPLGNGILIKKSETSQKLNTIRLKIAMDQLNKVLLPQPPKDEQTAIADFLDEKTEKINKAIAQKEKLIALLKERKQIIIQNAVTKGLNPNAKMKDSGVEWIGKIPKHWKVKRLKYIVKILKRIIGYEGPDVLSITQQGIKIKDIASGEGQLAMDYSKYQLIHKGEFAMNHMDLITGYVDISNHDGVISPDYRVFTPSTKEVTPAYLLALFQTCYKSKIFYRYGQGVSQMGRWRFPADNFNIFEIPIPPVEEQGAVLEYVEKKSELIDKAIALQKNQIEMLKEYKSVLIDSAVTGNIKVCDYAE